MIKQATSTSYSRNNFKNDKVNIGFRIPLFTLISRLFDSKLLSHCSMYKNALYFKLMLNIGGT